MNYQSSAILDKLKRNRKTPVRATDRPPGVLDGLGTTPSNTGTATRQAPLYEDTPPVTDPNAVSPQGQVPGDYKGGNILDFLSGDMKDLYESNLEGMLSGDAFAPYKAASNEAFARASQNIRARSAGGAGGVLGQGAATSAQQEAEQSVLSGLATKGIEEGMAESELKKAGMGMAFDLAQAGESSSQFWGSLEQAKELAEKGMLSQEKLKQMQITSNEKLAEDSNWLIQQGIDTENAKLFGYEDKDGKWVKGSLEINEEKWGFEKDMWQNEQAWASFHQAVLAGDYEGANEIAKANGLPTIDWTNVQEKEQLENISIAMGDIGIMLDYLDPDSPEYKVLITKYGELFGEKQKLLGIPFTDEDIDAFIQGITDDSVTDDDMGAFGAYLNATVIDWWENGMGKGFGTMLEGDAAAWNDTLNDPNATDEQIQVAAEGLAFLVNAAYRMDNGSVLTKKEKDALVAAGIAPEDWGDEDVDELKTTVENYWSGLEPHGALMGAGASDHELNDVYKGLEEKAAPVSDMGTYYTGQGNNGYKFNTPPPAVGTYVLFNGILMVITSGVQWAKTTGSTDRQFFTLQDVNTGATHTVKAHG